MLVIGFFRLLLRLARDETSFDTLLEQAFTIIAINWISLAILKSLARAKVRAKHIALAFLWRCCGLTAMS
jgi:hypothetical protein